MANGEITIGEVVRRIDRLDDKIDNGVFVRMDLLRAKEESIDRRIDSLFSEITELREWQVWATRSLIGAGIGIAVEAVMLVFALSRALR